ncbi:MAG: hypothetical protein ABIN97_18790, partial [Ginsengibacter sp.]
MNLEEKKLIFDNGATHTSKSRLRKADQSTMNINILKINFKGGIIPHIHLYNTLVAATKSNLHYVRFGLRQQLLLDVEIENLENFTAELDM